MRRIALLSVLVATAVALVPVRPAAASPFCHAGGHEPTAWHHELHGRADAWCDRPVTVLKATAVLERRWLGGTAWTEQSEMTSVEKNASWAQAQAKTACGPSAVFRTKGTVDFVDYLGQTSGSGSHTSDEVTFVCTQLPDLTCCPAAPAANRSE